ncbi:kinase-like domain-containing protein [Chaetomidium leptoderma]|uniref:Kinase-like domain-containing protein n=1 Tax=Chaetomidium leptoderma TaxID=669021 RepID=A0AAN6VHX2_9PEZI|nr:kinase-like domain-containing protein [Chaetomidium leptoderma]
MPSPRPETHVSGSVQAIDKNTWLVGGNALLSRRPCPSTDEPSWSDGSGGYFTISNTTPFPLPETFPHPKESAALPLVYSAGDQSAVWRAGEAFLKVHDMRSPLITREHVTLEFLHRKKPLGFDISSVLYHGEWDGRYYLVVSRVSGQTLNEAWPTMDELQRQQYVGRVAEACKEMAEWKGESIAGVDGGELFENYLAKTEKDGYESLALEDLCQNCTSVGMDPGSSSLVFYHCDLGPGNILVDPASGSLGIIDWERAGYVPREWVRTKFHLSSGMDFPDGDEASKSDWRRFVARRLKEMGFSEVIDGWLAFQG